MRNESKVTEKSSCGVGFIISRNLEFTNDTVKQGLHALRCVEHRGACAADQITGDGAGIMTDIPFELLGYAKGTVAVASIMVTTNQELQRKLLQIFETTFAFWDMDILSYRTVPIDPSVLGEHALKTMPVIVQAIIKRPHHCNTDSSFNRYLYLACRTTFTKQKRFNPVQNFFISSLSVNTIVYKALTKSDVLDKFYLDLQNPLYKSRFSLIHRRFSTNTATSWDKAQPFRLIAHNGEINTIEGNRSWAYSREKSLGLPRNELITHEGISDSGSLNEMVEALMNRSSLPHVEDALALMIPPAEQGKLFYKFWSRAMEPWDGPALISFSDGETIGARLDRNGFRPCRWTMTKDYFYLSSEAGSFITDEEKIISKGALRAGGCVNISLRTGEIDFNDPGLSRENFNVNFDPRLFKLGYRKPEIESCDLDKKYIFNYSEEDFNKILIPMIKTAKEPIGSMGDTARPAILSKEPRSFFDYFYQNFAQVTNPPLDYLREKMVTNLSVYLGSRPNIFAKKELIPPPVALELKSPVLSLGQFEYIKGLNRERTSDAVILSETFDITFNRQYGAVDLKSQLENISKNIIESVKQGISIIILSDRSANFENLPIPVLLILRKLVIELDKAGLRFKISVVIDSAQIFTTHHIAMTICAGASAVCPYLALQIARYENDPNLKSLDEETKEKNLIKAFESGLLKVMSKMGISVIRSYQSSRLFTIMGLDKEFSWLYFRGVSSVIGGLGIDEIAENIVNYSTIAEKAMEQKKLISTFQFREHSKLTSGEKHSMTSRRTHIVHELVRNAENKERENELYNEYLNSGSEDSPVNIRNLFELKNIYKSVDISEVQSQKEILSKFGSGAMSFGAISAESQRDIILAMEEIGGRSNSGEGGENPYYFTEGITATIKQVASGRFGVTATYLVTGKEIQIKVAQGAKPGEGGQLMAAKVTEDIARARHSMTNVDLISPPPLHDIYSIEDLKELIFELKQVKPDAKVSVKLVSGANIGTIAIGVAKAGADIIHISGGDGGTGAATLSSMKHTGLPFEFGLIEVHKALVENNLRNNVILRTDGGLSTGKDIIIASIMGAEEFDFGKLILIAQGCVMARVCEKNTCPTGIATHDPKFKAKYKGTKEHIVKLLQHIAEDIRSILAKSGLKSLKEIIGRNDLLDINKAHLDLINSRKLDLSFILGSDLTYETKVVKPISEGISLLNKWIVDDFNNALVNNSKINNEYPVSTSDRAVLATLSGIISENKHKNLLFDIGKISEKPSLPYSEKINLTFHGSAGQGFGVFMTDEINVRLFGEANDSVGKSMSGGKIVITQQQKSGFIPEKNVIIGNCALYGATGGSLYVRGIAGDRFAVRNSGATAVVEGTGLHACEYMTNGTVVILGKVEQNLGSGMTGGKIFLWIDQEDRINYDYIISAPFTGNEYNELRFILENHLYETGSNSAMKILEDWDKNKKSFVKYLPVNIAEKLK